MTHNLPTPKAVLGWWERGAAAPQTDPGAIHKAVTILEHIETVADVSQENSHVLLITGAAREDVPALLSTLLQADVPVYRVNSQEPSLEDVYFSLQGKKEKVS